MNDPLDEIHDDNRKENMGSNKLTSTEAQEMLARLLKAILAQLAIAKSSQQSEAAVADALNRLEQARVALADRKNG